MSTSASWQQLRKEIRTLSKGRCEYCKTPDWLVGTEHEIDHILARANGGPTAFPNLCYACSICNGHKLTKQFAIDPSTGNSSALFHPRKQQWSEHFKWGSEGTVIIGVTECGRATVEALRMNEPLMIIARSIWVSSGLHPPKD